MEALVTAALSKEEDLLHRSKKKSKVGGGPKEFFSKKVVSYKDVCLGVNGVDDGYTSSDTGYDFWEESVEDDGVDGSEEMEVLEEDNMKILCPLVKLSKSERIGTCIPWKRALIIKLLGKKVSLKFLQGRLQNLWQPKDRMEVIDIDNEYFVVRFSNWSDLSRVYEGGPWVIMGHYLVVQRWKPEFLPYEDEFKRWGHTVKIDPNTLRQYEDEVGTGMMTERGKFARICVEVDLRKVLISRFRLNGRVYHVEYEGLHLICFNCGRFGHRKECCPLLVEESKNMNQQATSSSDPATQKGDDGVEPEGGPAAEEFFGPWMMVQRKNRAKIQKGSDIDRIREKNQEPNIGNLKNQDSGSRFAALNLENQEAEDNEEEESQKDMTGNHEERNSRGCSPIQNNRIPNDREPGDLPPRVNVAAGKGGVQRMHRKSSKLKTNSFTGPPASPRGEKRALEMGCASPATNVGLQQPSLKTVGTRKEDVARGKQNSENNDDMDCSEPNLEREKPVDLHDAGDPGGGGLLVVHNVRPPDENIVGFKPSIENMSLDDLKGDVAQVEKPVVYISLSNSL
ncbi:Zinc finger, CCHC-type [Sesbania bispinosa]|nr:Zinc finger, CCHC-type [Sesbania bispinosa]